MAGDSDHALHNSCPGLDTAFGARPQASRGLAIRRGRIGDALHRSDGSSFMTISRPAVAVHIFEVDRRLTFQPTAVARALQR